MTKKKLNEEIISKWVESGHLSVPDNTDDEFAVASKYLSSLISIPPESMKKVFTVFYFLSFILDYSYFNFGVMLI